MPQEKSFARKAIESLALKVILFIGGLVGAAVLTWYSANSAWMHHLPGYKVGLLVAAILALCAIALYFLILSIARIPLRNAPAGSLLEPHDHWLLTIAERDRLEPQSAVVVTECSVHEALNSEEAHVIFRLYIRNCSVYAITVDPKLTGFISLNSRRPTGNITLPSVLPHNLSHCMGDTFSIRQELSDKDVAVIAELDKSSPLQGAYDFSNLHITITTNSREHEVTPARLLFKRVARRRTVNPFELV